MAEIAARAGALVGSLYHFFPSKETLAEALIHRYAGIVDAAFAAIDSRAVSMPIEELADALLNLILEVQGESRAMVALLDARADWSEKRREFRDATVGHITRTLTLRSPRLDPESARHMAVLLLHGMKTMKALDGRRRRGGRGRAPAHDAALPDEPALSSATGRQPSILRSGRSNPPDHPSGGYPGAAAPRRRPAPRGRGGPAGPGASGRRRGREVAGIRLALQASLGVAAPPRTSADPCRVVVRSGAPGRTRRRPPAQWPGARPPRPGRWATRSSTRGAGGI